METKKGVSISGEGDAAIASFASTCVSDVEEITVASTRVREYIQQHHPQRVVFDFSGVKFFSSQVLSLLLEAHAHLQSRNGQVAICALDAQLRGVFQVTNLDKVFAFYSDRQAAIAAPAL